MNDHFLLSLGMFFLLLLGVVNVIVVMGHIAYINRVSHRITYQDGQLDMILESLSRQNNMLVNIMENR